MPRENVATKARRLLCEGRVAVHLAHSKYVHAGGRGDSASYYEVVHELGQWSCPCECRQLCSHVQAVMLEAQRRGWIQKLGWVGSGRKRHGRPLRLGASRIYVGPTSAA